MPRGKNLTEEKVDRIRRALYTDMPIPAIAERFGCCRGAVSSINKKYQIRSYGGRKSTWENCK